MSLTNEQIIEAIASKTVTEIVELIAAMEEKFGVSAAAAVAAAPAAGGLGGLMKQAQQMQEKMQKMQEEIAQLEVTGESGAGLVKITINGAHNCRRIDIDPSLMEDDKEMLEDLIAAAFNDAVRRAEELQKEKMASVTAGMPLPPGMKFPF